MTHLDTELKQLKASTIEMWQLVILQMKKAYEAVSKLDRDMVHDINANEKRVDAFEIKINMDCENILALFNPLANDLRFVLSVLKINYNLERIGDYAHGIAKLIADCDSGFDKHSIKETELNTLFDVAITMLEDALDAFENENPQKARVIFKHDEQIDKANKKSVKIVASLIADNPKDTEKYLNLLSIIRRLERAGDHTKNIAEEIIFYIEAKVLRHAKKKEKLN
jgi:phosphate transport system protein